MIGLPRSGFRKFASVLLVTFCLALLVSVFHHHEDGQTHDTCSLCVYIAHHSDITVQNEQPTYLLVFHLLFSWETDFTFLSTFHSIFLIRAPPA